MEKEMRSSNQLKLTRLEEERKCVERKALEKSIFFSKLQILLQQIFLNAVKSEATQMSEKREKLRNELAKLRLTQGESDSSLQTRLDQLEADCGDIKGRI